jgi:putative oxidoreductase
MTDSVLLLGRVLISAIFISAGLTKLLAAAASQAMMAKYGLPVPMLAWLITVVIELGGGLALLFGVATRPVAVVLGLWCIATALVAHTNFADPSMRAHS